MSKDSEGRRAWIKNAAIIFLVILLLLTFFSNTILNITLPEVSAQYAQYGSISSSVKVTGTVKANESYNVMYEADQAEAEGGLVQSRKVVSVYVKEGDTVSMDTPILALQGGASSQLEAAQNEYDKLKREYDLALLQDTVDGLTSDKTLSDAEQAVADKKKELAELKEEYASVLGGADTTSVIEARIEALEEEIEVLNERISAQSEKIAEIKGKIQSAENMIEEDILSTLTVAEKLAIAEEEYAVLEQTYNELSVKVETLKAEAERIESTSGDIDKANALTNEIRTLEKQLESLEKQYDREEEDYYGSKEKLDRKYAEYRDARNEAAEKYIEYENTRFVMGSGDPTESETPENEIPEYNEATAEQLYAAWQAAEEALLGCTEEIAAFQKAYDRSSEDLEEQIDTLERQISDAYEKLDVVGLPEVDDVVNYATDYDLAEAKRKYEEAGASLAEVTSKYEEAKTKVESLRKQNTASGAAAEYTLLLNTYQTEMDSLEAQLKQKKKDLEAKQKELSKTETPAEPEEILKQIEAAESAVRDLEARLEITKATETQSDKTTEFARADQLKKLEELQKKIEEYKNAPENTAVNAPIAGRIVSIDVVPGDTVTSGQTVARIEIADKGYVCEISMASEEARKIQIGAECTISNSWWYPDISATVSQIRTDPQSQGKNRIVVITVNGTVSEGQNLSFTIGDRSQSYDCVLPNSAIREDNDGKFVLTVTSKKTPLGMRYTAVRTNIEVIASDDTKSAVSGLYGSEFVITNSTSPISDKQQVRLAEG